MMTKNEILKTLKSIKSVLRKEYGIEEFALFGSFASDKANEYSDIDIVVLKMKKKNAFTLIKAKHFLEKLLNRKVDIGLYTSIRPFIQKRIKRELIYV